MFLFLGSIDYVQVSWQGLVLIECLVRVKRLLSQLLRFKYDSLLANTIKRVVKRFQLSDNINVNLIKFWYFIVFFRIWVSPRARSQ